MRKCFKDFPQRFGRRTLITAAVLLATNVVTGLITAHIVRARDYSNTNLIYLLNWGTISQRFEEARGRKLSYVLPKTNAEIYSGYEDTACFVVQHPTAPRPINLDSDRQMLLRWAVAADQFQSGNVNIKVDPAVWKAFLAQGSRDLSLYRNLRDDLALPAHRTVERAHDRLVQRRVEVSSLRLGLRR